MVLISLLHLMTFWIQFTNAELDHPVSKLCGNNFVIVLRIRDFLLRIRIRGSVPLTNESGSGSCFFKKVHLLHFSKKKSLKEVTKQQKPRFFLLFLLDDRKIRIRTVPLTNGSVPVSGSRRPKTYGYGFRYATLLFKCFFHLAELDFKIKQNRFYFRAIFFLFFINFACNEDIVCVTLYCTCSLGTLSNYSLLGDIG